MSCLIGAAPGYVGFEEGGNTYTIFVFPDTNLNLGQLTEAVQWKLAVWHIVPTDRTAPPR